jgi:GntR family transcriptional regulator
MDVPLVLDPASPVPLYYQLQQQMRQHIDDGAWPAGFVLPAENDLAAQLGVSRATVRQAIAGLVQEGRLERRRNRGTKVTAPPLRQSLQGFYSFARTMAERGLSQHSQVVTLQTERAPADVITGLGLAQPQAVHLERVRFADETPLMIETSWFAADVGQCLFAADLSEASIYDVLDAAGIPIIQATEFIRPIVLSSHQADVLGVARGDPAFFVERTSYSLKEPVELRRSVIRGDRYLYSVNLPRSALAQPVMQYMEHET